MKFVYVLISDEKDYYTEQCLVSIHSLRLNNPKAHIVVITDKYTLSTLDGNRGRIKDNIDEFKTIEVPKKIYE